MQIQDTFFKYKDETDLMMTGKIKTLYRNNYPDSYMNYSIIIIDL